MRYAVYVPKTGEILRTGLCPAGSMDSQAQPGEAVLEVGAEVRDDTHKIVNGQAMPK